MQDKARSHDQTSSKHRQNETPQNHQGIRPHPRLQSQHKDTPKSSREFRRFIGSKVPRQQRLKSVTINLKSHSGRMVGPTGSYVVADIATANTLPVIDR